MAQTQAKASTIGLTESLTDELVAMSKDADFTAKATNTYIQYLKFQVYHM